jgi:diaminopimelate epimerase
MMIVPFTKASACGNDFLIVDGAYAPPDVHDFSRRICDRHDGVGADGVEWLLPAAEADMHARLINADGSEAEISGNGTRCVAAYMVANGGPAKMSILTGAGIKRCQLMSRDSNSFEFEIDMGEPHVAADFSLRFAFGEVQGTPVSMGNPHYVIFVPEFPAAWRAEAAEIGRHRAFEHGVNVEYVRVKSASEIEVRFFERGVGETQSSGTGACAAAVASVAAGRMQSPVRVQAPGGAQVVRWPGGHVFLRGPAQLICRGEFFV